MLRMICNSCRSVRSNPPSATNLSKPLWTSEPSLPYRVTVRMKWDPCMLSWASRKQGGITNSNSQWIIFPWHRTLDFLNECFSCFAIWDWLYTSTPFPVYNVHLLLLPHNYKRLCNWSSFLLSVPFLCTYQSCFAGLVVWILCQTFSSIESLSAIHWADFGFFSSFSVLYVLVDWFSVLLEDWSCWGSSGTEFWIVSVLFCLISIQPHQ